MGGIDLVISRMVMEHVGDAARTWANIANLLAPGGVALAFHPTLYAPPFVINWLIPERLTAPVLKLFFADRHDGDFPKFPARYDLCTADPAVIDPALGRAGFREVLSAPFWGDRYFRHLPGVRSANDALSSLAEARDWRWLASYAYTIAAQVRVECAKAAKAGAIGEPGVLGRPGRPRQTRTAVRTSR